MSKVKCIDFLNCNENFSIQSNEKTKEEAIRLIYKATYRLKNQNEVLEDLVFDIGDKSSDSCVFATFINTKNENERFSSYKMIIVSAGVIEFPEDCSFFFNKFEKLEQMNFYVWKRGRQFNDLVDSKYYKEENFSELFFGKLDALKGNTEYMRNVTNVISLSKIKCLYKFFPDNFKLLERYQDFFITEMIQWHCSPYIIKNGCYPGPTTWFGEDLYMYINQIEQQEKNKPTKFIEKIDLYNKFKGMFEKQCYEKYCNKKK